VLPISIGDVIALFSAAKSFGLFGPRPLSDDEIRQKFSEFRAELKNAFDDERERLRIAEIKLIALGTEWDKKAITPEDRRLISDQIHLTTVALETRLLEAKSLIPDIIKMYSSALSEAKLKRPSTYDAVEAWVEDGRRYGMENIYMLELLIRRSKELECLFYR
jgi:hypothetical protein